MTWLYIFFFFQINLSSSSVDTTLVQLDAAYELVRQMQSQEEDSWIIFIFTDHSSLVLFGRFQFQFQLT